VDRAEFECFEAARREKTVVEMRAAGFYSARCECSLDECPGFQAVAVPLDALPSERRLVLNELRGLAPQPFGGT
jgi:hypothetical protein